MVKNVLFIMCDQLRWDYLSCTGHPTLKTPNIDRLAEMGVRFDRTYVQSPVCGPSRASTLTGRTVFSHGATWNHVPMPIGEYTIGDYLRPHGVRVGVSGKTHFFPDPEGMARLGASDDKGNYLTQGGYEPFERDDGLHPSHRVNPKLAYNEWLRAHGYGGENPWHDFANSGENDAGEVQSGWLLRNSNLPARVREEHSETAYTTMRGREFIESAGDTPWLLHLSYIKPHWPYVAPAPYHSMYSTKDMLPVNCDEKERVDPHPVYAAFMDMDPGEAFSRQEVRDAVIPIYMGLVKQIDDHLGKLLDWMEETDRMKDTMIVFTSDHGDYLGDHWLGEKELFHEASVRVPLIIYDPDESADDTRGHVSEDLVEAIDLLPTFMDVMDIPPDTQRLESHSLLPFIRGTGDAPNRACVLSELDFASYEARKAVGSGASDSRIFMIRTERWKYIYYRTFRPQLFDLENDPDEFTDLGASAEHEQIRQELQQMLMNRLIDRKNRVGMSDEELDARAAKPGVPIGKW